MEPIIYYINGKHLLIVSYLRLGRTPQDNSFCPAGCIWVLRWSVSYLHLCASYLVLVIINNCKKNYEISVASFRASLCNASLSRQRFDWPPPAHLHMTFY